MQNQNRLDDYIDAIGSRLRFVTPAERQENLTEIRQHLQAAVDGHLEGGVSEEEANDEVLRQFGSATTVSRRLRLAYLRRQLTRFRYSYPGAIVATTFLGFLVQMLCGTLIDPVMSRLVQGDLLGYEGATLVSMFVRSIFFGWIVAYASGRRSIPALAVYLTWIYCVFIAPQIRQADMPTNVRLHVELMISGAALSCGLGVMLALRRSAWAAKRYAD